MPNDGVRINFAHNQTAYVMKCNYIIPNDAAKCQANFLPTQRTFRFHLPLTAQIIPERKGLTTCANILAEKLASPNN